MCRGKEIEMDLKLNGKVVLISGATGGVGRAMTKAFLAEGCKVGITGRSQERLDAFQAELGVSEDRVFSLAGDVRNEDEVKAWVEGAAEKFGGIDVICPNAGIESPSQQITDFSIDTYNVVFDTNVVGVCYFIKYATPYLIKSKGSIVVTGSNGSVLGFPGMTIYCASKHAVAGVVKSVAAELGYKGVNCNYLAPGGIDTDMMLRIEKSTFGDTKTHEEAMHVFCDAQCFDQRYITPEEVAFMATVMASEWLSHTSGARISMDGGCHEVLRP